MPRRVAIACAIYLIVLAALGALVVHTVSGVLLAPVV